ncbi:MAG: efflux RND transporter periplasmic adaptor subunit, partial [Terrimicrobiaceae bacterium]|nr:efflux RND transporter periplasmic adaptor subunit [Terrimicrobiaceae bacterium]
AYTIITAPFDGVVTRRHVQRGDLAVPGRALAEVENPGALRLEATVPETLAAGLEGGQKLVVRIEAAGALLEGTVAEIAPVSDPASRTVLVKLDLPPHPGLRSGQFGRLRVPTPARAALRIPASAIIRRGSLEFVTVNDGGTARLRIVRTGRSDGGLVEILAGLDEGELVFSQGAEAPADGTPAGT